jgi:hypothetical protein
MLQISSSLDLLFIGENPSMHGRVIIFGLLLPNLYHQSSLATLQSVNSVLGSSNDVFSCLIPIDKETCTTTVLNCVFKTAMAISRNEVLLVDKVQPRPVISFPSYRG